MDKEVILVIKQLTGGGAERMLLILADELLKKGFHASVLITHQHLKDADLDRVTSRVKVISLPDELEKDCKPEVNKVNTTWIRMTAKAEKLFFKDGKARQRVKMYQVRNYDKVAWMKRYLSKHRDAVLIAFLYDSIFLTLLAADKSNRVIISERGDPEQSMHSSTVKAFFELQFKQANRIVFQSPNVRQWYRDHFSLDGTVIPNPITPGLPEPHQDIRKKRIVNFCRISTQKNLRLLVNAFERFYQTHPDYELYIYGDAVGNGTEGYIESVSDLISRKTCKNSIHLLPSLREIHTEILDYAMFVSSSDYEGMSNSMLEAMAIGLPTICTDCPSGGAHAVIRDHENGILTPVGDVDALAKVMSEVADDPELAKKLSQNGEKIRDTLSVDKIINQWLELIND